MANPSVIRQQHLPLLKNIPLNMAIPSATLAITSATYSTHVVITPAMVALHQPHIITHNGINNICHKTHGTTSANIIMAITSAINVELICNHEVSIYHCVQK